MKNQETCDEGIARLRRELKWGYLHAAVGIVLMLFLFWGFHSAVFERNPESMWFGRGMLAMVIMRLADGFLANKSKTSRMLP